MGWGSTREEIAPLVVRKFNPAGAGADGFSLDSAAALVNAASAFL
jgi:hypothetical protein